MKFAILMMFALASNAFAAENSILQCVTDGSGPTLNLVQKDDQSIIRISDESEEVREYSARTNFRNISKGVSDTIIGTSSRTQVYPGLGVFTEAILLRISDGIKNGYVAENGNVYKFTCQKR
jgi:hypothetical protein